MHRAIIDPGPAPCRGPDLPEQEPRRVSLMDVELSPNARFTIGRAVKEIAANTGMDERELIRRMQGEVWWHPGHDGLMFVIAAQEIDAMMYVEIPAGHWSFRQGSSATQ